MTEFITKEQAKQLAFDAGMSVAPSGNGYFDNSAQLQKLINLAFEQRLEQRAYVTKRGAIYGGKQTKDVTPLYALKGDSK